MSYTEQLLNEKLAEEDAYEAACPICDFCGDHITDSDYFYDIDGLYCCTSIDCIYKFISEFKRDVISYINDNR